MTLVIRHNYNKKKRQKNAILYVYNLTKLLRCVKPERSNILMKILIINDSDKYSLVIS